MAITLDGTTGVTTPAILNNAGNGVGNIGNATGYFNTAFVKATSAQYADLAEMYVADSDYEPGTVLIFGGNNEVSISTTDADNRVAGVVSTNPAHVMNSAVQGKYNTTVFGRASAHQSAWLSAERRDDGVSRQWTCSSLRNTSSWHSDRQSS